MLSSEVGAAPANTNTTTACGTLERAVAHAHALASSGDQVLLSPACASFDQFKSYDHRGVVFRGLVEAL